MKRILSSMVFLLVVLALVLTGCSRAMEEETVNGGSGSSSSSSSSSGSDAAPTVAADQGSSASTEGDLVISSTESSDQDQALKVGQKVLFKLPADYTWKIYSMPEMIVGPVKDAALTDDTQAVFEAKMAGKATLQATGSPKCKKDNPPCDKPSIQFNVKFAVSAAE